MKLNKWINLFAIGNNGITHIIRITLEIGTLFYKKKLLLLLLPTDLKYIWINWCPNSVDLYFLSGVVFFFLELFINWSYFSFFFHSRLVPIPCEGSTSIINLFAPPSAISLRETLMKDSSFFISPFHKYCLES